MSNDPWWKLGEEEASKAVCGNVDAVNKHQAYREQNNLNAARFYGGTEYMGFGIGNYARTATTSTAAIALNVVRSAVSTVTAKIAKNKVKPTPVTNDGNYDQQRRAKWLDLWGQGWFYGERYHKKAPIACRDSSLFGTGFLKVWGDHVRKKINIERTFPNEIKIDDADAINGEPRVLYQEKVFSREVAAAIWKDHKEAIMNANPADGAFLEGHTSKSDQIMVREAWRLPSFTGADDGKHFLGISGAAFAFEKWERDTFPFAIIRWDEPLLGFFGTGIASELDGIQSEINFLLQRIQEAFRLLGAPCIFVERSSDVALDQLTNVVGNVYAYTGTPPTVAAFQTIHPEVFAHLNWLYQRAYEIVGVSMLSAGSRKPAGLDSGAALREYNDKETERFSLFAQDYEQLAVDTFTLGIQEAKSVAKANGGDFVMRVNGKRYGRRFVEDINWKDVDMEADQFVLQVFPSSSLPTEPAGRRAELGERIKMGVLTPDEAMDQMDLPDTEAANNYALAARNDIEETYHNYFYAPEDKVRDRPFEPFQDPALALKIGQIRYLQARSAGVPEERLELARGFMAQAKARLDEMKAEEAALAPAQPAMPQQVAA